MQKKKMFLLPTLILSGCLILLSGCADDGDDGADGLDGAGQVITLSHLASTASQAFDESAAEIVTFDASNQNILTVNANSGQVDVFDAATLAALDGADPVQNIDLAAMLVADDKVADTTVVGAANSIAVYDDLAAIAVESAPKTDNGWVVFVNTETLDYVNAVEVGALPDMLIFTDDGAKVIVANEGEPNEGYTIDPEGSISIINTFDYSITTVGFTDFNAAESRNAELPTAKMILDGYNATVAQSLEPEYIALGSDNTKAYVVLQENNAVAVIDLVNSQVDKIIGLGFKDHSIPGNELDPSQKDGVNIGNWPVMGIYMPDSIASFNHNGKDYLITANEGDSREDWLNPIVDQAGCETAGYFFSPEDEICVDEFSAKDYYDSDNVTLDSGLETNGGFGEDDELRRLKFSYFTTQLMNGGTDFEKLYAYGARSFSIWDAETGIQVFDSGSDFERITAQIYGEDFNNDNAENTGDDRSDNKGPEPEGVTVGIINGHTYAFIALERMGGIMVYDVSNPYAPTYVQYINNRDVSIDISEGYTAAVGDLGPEGLSFVAAEDSPNDHPLLIVGNEVSGTTTVYQIDVTLLQE
ncbi:choice-of-anchor I family protein [uncultured Desulfuromusa sp.]|uniref:choice-of-anchor I family protein n=1 Tax=uncultured Desulfuromusa sp. TaxID=219183 RepID=UPI002AA7B839|nr:choice-of-anchor I family protein [uncultured Desulfuromusa sp.]